jgi:hypothetical protein
MAVLLCMGCPAGITFGIDTMQWQRACAQRAFMRPRWARAEGGLVATQLGPSSAACATSRRCARARVQQHCRHGVPLLTACAHGVPQGLHFVYHSSGHDTGCGEFVDVSSGEVLVRRWDEATETFAPGCGMSGARIFCPPPRPPQRRFARREPRARARV